MNHHSSGLRVAYALLVTGLGLLTNLDSVAALPADDFDSQPDALHLVIPSDPDLTSHVARADAAYAQAMQEHLNHLG